MLHAGVPDGALRVVLSLANAVSVDAEVKQSWVTLTRTGAFSDPRYGKFEITGALLSSMVENFNKRVFGQDVMIDVEHKPQDGAAGTIKQLSLEHGKLRALVEWTPYGLAAVRERGYRYMSVEFHPEFVDNEHGAAHGPVLMGAALTTRPVIKRLDPVQLSQDGEKPPVLLHADIHKHIEEHEMDKAKLLAALVLALTNFKLHESVIDGLKKLCEAALGPVSDETAAKKLVADYEAMGKSLAEQLGGKPVVVNLSAPAAAGLTADDVKRLLAEEDAKRADAVKKLAETREAKVKLLSDTINAATGLPDELKKSLADSVADIVGDLPDDKVKALAETLVARGNETVVARKLGSMGYEVRGTTHITVDSSNEVKALQERVDKRLFTGVPDHKRYLLSGGKPVEENKALVDAALAQYDAEHGLRLHEEYQRSIKLASGDSVVSDVAIPASFERTVIREALYQVVGLSLCDTNSAQFSAVVQLPYSYRDTGAAGVSSLRKYEGGSIARAAVKQALEEARPLPQKLAFEVSDELRYLSGNGQIDFDILSENAMNAARITAEDIEALTFNEFLNASDQFATAAISGEDLELQADGTKKVFVLAQWPVVRPKKVYDLQGTQVGSTLYPVTVTYNSVARSEYDGTGTQASGTYYVLDYNKGEIYLVNQAGAIQTPADGTAYTISYTYTTNVVKWDSDLPSSTKADEHWDSFLYNFALRKTAVEDRAYMPNVATMSGTLRTQIERARQFGANNRREGTSLLTDGNLGRVKDVPSFRSYAPGLNAGDVRTVLMERGTTRFRMLKPWTLGQLENQKDSNGRFTGKKEAYGDQFIVVHTPTQLKGAMTSMVVYSATARVARAAP